MKYVATKKSGKRRCLGLETSVVGGGRFTLNEASGEGKSKEKLGARSGI